MNANQLIKFFCRFGLSYIEIPFFLGTLFVPVLPLILRFPTHLVSLCSMTLLRTASDYALATQSAHPITLLFPPNIQRSLTSKLLLSLIKIPIPQVNSSLIL